MMAIDGEDLFLQPFYEVVARGKEAAANADAGEDDGDGDEAGAGLARVAMRRSAHSLIKEGERALQRLMPLWEAQVARHGAAFIEAIQDNEGLQAKQRSLEDLLYDLDDYTELETFDAGRLADVQSASKAFALALLETARRVRIEDRPGPLMMAAAAPPSSPPPSSVAATSTSSSSGLSSWANQISSNNNHYYYYHHHHPQLQLPHTHHRNLPHHDDHQKLLRSGSRAGGGGGGVGTASSGGGTSERGVLPGGPPPDRSLPPTPARSSRSRGGGGDGGCGSSLRRPSSPDVLGAERDSVRLIATQQKQQQQQLHQQQHQQQHHHHHGDREICCSPVMSTTSGRISAWVKETTSAAGAAPAAPTATMTAAFSSPTSPPRYLPPLATGDHHTSAQTHDFSSSNSNSNSGGGGGVAKPDSDAWPRPLVVHNSLDALAMRAHPGCQPQSPLTAGSRTSVYTSSDASFLSSPPRSASNVPTSASRTTSLPSSGGGGGGGGGGGAGNGRYSVLNSGGPLLAPHQAAQQQQQQHEPPTLVMPAVKPGRPRAQPRLGAGLLADDAEQRQQQQQQHHGNNNNNNKAINVEEDNNNDNKNGHLTGSSHSDMSASCRIGPRSTLYQLKGFCVGAQAFKDRGRGEGTKVRPEYASKGDVAVCVGCDYRHKQRDLDMDYAQSPDANFRDADVRYRLRFAYKSHLPQLTAHAKRYGCLFCAEQGHTPHPGDATVFTTEEALFCHLARHPRPLVPVPGVRVLYGRLPSQNDDEDRDPASSCREDYDLHFPPLEDDNSLSSLPPPHHLRSPLPLTIAIPPPAPSPYPPAAELRRLPTAAALRDHLKPYGAPPLADPDGRRGGVLQFLAGARVVGVRFPDRWRGKWCVGWHDGAEGSFPAKAVALEPPPLLRLPLLSGGPGAGAGAGAGTTVEARWKWQPGGGGGGETSVQAGGVGGGWLAFGAGDVLAHVSYQDESDWCWTGTTKKGRTGLFPRSHVKLETLRHGGLDAPPPPPPPPSKNGPGASLLPGALMRRLAAGSGGGE